MSTSGKGHRMRVSVVVPVLNEAERIGACVASARRDYSRDEVEIIVVDGGSSDGTGQRVPVGEKVICSPRGRALQMNRGAEESSGEVLVFCHGDTLLPLGWREGVLQALERPGVSCGCFRLRLDPPRGVLRVINRLPFPRNWRFVFGDQVQFMTRDAFDAVGGFPGIPLMEDVEMSRRLARRGRIVRVKLTAVTSSRRFLERGPFKQLVVDLTCWTRYVFLGARSEDLLRLYAPQECDEE